MDEPIDVLALYLHLAHASQLRRQPQACDRFLVLSGVQASMLHMHRIAALCRSRVLAHNPHHLIHRWPTLTQALDDSDFLHFLKQLQRRYPLEKAERMLIQLGIERGRERATYFTDEEYAASLLGTNLAALDEQFGD